MSSTDGYFLIFDFPLNNISLLPQQQHIPKIKLIASRPFSSFTFLFININIQNRDPHPYTTAYLLSELLPQPRLSALHFTVTPPHVLSEMHLSIILNGLALLGVVAGTGDFFNHTGKCTRDYPRRMCCWQPSTLEPEELIPDIRKPSSFPDDANTTYAGCKLFQIPSATGEGRLTCCV
jgi:hypothetical protein